VFGVNPRILITGLIRLLIIRRHVVPFRSQCSLERKDGDCSCLLPREVEIRRQIRKLQPSSEAPFPMLSVKATVFGLY
jgi:hypothetical protein